VIETELGSVDLGFARSWERSSAASLTAPAAHAREAGERTPEAGPEEQAEPDGGSRRPLARVTLRALSAASPGAGGAGARVGGQTIESVGPLASVGECCEIQDQFGRRTWPR
jgi:hypothetical protein